ncbi:MAG: glycerate kinase, partial [Planctomycetota bacterium]
MQIVVAPDSFKDALGSEQAGRRIMAGVHKAVPEARVQRLVMSDGGEGFARAYAQNEPDAMTTREPTVDALGRPTLAEWIEIGHSAQAPSTAVIMDLAGASGIERFKPHERDPFKTSTLGSGMLLSKAVASCAATRYILGLGGSATVDAGIGIAMHLGVKLTDRDGQPIKPYAGGQALTRISRIKLPERSVFEDLGARLVLACDVDNPLAGAAGAAHVYGPQKGATPQQVEQLDAGLRHIAGLWRDQLGVDVEQLPGAGAAGGVAGGLVAMLGAELVPGAELILETIGFDERISGADLVITGEGRLDHQSLNGKAVIAVARRCQAAGVACHSLVGSAGAGGGPARTHRRSPNHHNGGGV